MGIGFDVSVFFRVFWRVLVREEVYFRGKGREESVMGRARVREVSRRGEWDLRRDFGDRF